MVHQERLSIETSGHRDMHDITERVGRVVAASGIQTGIAQVFNVGSTGVVGAIEFEPGLQHDLPEMLDRLIPPSRQYGHEQAWHDGNGHSHLQATLMPSLLDDFDRCGGPIAGASPRGYRSAAKFEAFDTMGNRLAATETLELTEDPIYIAGGDVAKFFLRAWQTSGPAGAGAVSSSAP